MGTLWPTEPVDGGIDIAWVGCDGLFWQGVKAWLSQPLLRLRPAQTAAAVRQPEALIGVNLLVWDLGLASGADVVELQQAWPFLAGLPVLVVTAHMDEALFKSLLALGVDGVLSKQIEGHYFVQSLRHIAAGQKVFEPAYRGFVHDSQDALFQTLTAREREILAYLAKGVSNKVIAEALAVAPSTVKVHVQNILRKLGLSSRVQAAVYAIRQQG